MGITGGLTLISVAMPEWSVVRQSVQKADLRLTKAAGDLSGCRPPSLFAVVFAGLSVRVSLCSRASHSAAQTSQENVIEPEIARYSVSEVLERTNRRRLLLLQTSTQDNGPKDNTRSEGFTVKLLSALSKGILFKASSMA